MATVLKKPLPSYTGAAQAGGKIVYDFATGNLTYNSIMIRLTNGAAAARAVSDIIGEMRIKIGTTVVRRILGYQFDYLVNFPVAGLGLHMIGNDPFLKINFAEINRRTFEGEDSLGWGMANVNSFQIEIDIAAGATTGELDFTADQGLVTSVMGAPGNPPFLQSVVWLEQKRATPTSAGKYNLQGIPTDRPIYKIHLFSQYVDKVMAEFNSNIIYEAKKNVAVADQSTELLNPSSTIFTIPFDQRQRVTDRLDARGPGYFNVELEMGSGAENFDVVFETLGYVPGIGRAS